MVAESLAQLRRELRDWGLGAQRHRVGWTHEPVNRRRSHARAKFDTVLGWWIRQPNRDPRAGVARQMQHWKCRAEFTRSASLPPDASQVLPIAPKKRSSLVPEFRTTIRRSLSRAAPAARKS